MTDSRDLGRRADPPLVEPRVPASRGDSPWRDDAHAVVIGIDEYLDSRIPNLRFARADAEAMYAVLTDPAIGRLKPENVTLLLDAQATERNIRSALGTQLPRRAGKDSTVVIYYAGHGAPVIDPRSNSADGLEKYLVPHDAQADDLRATGISMDAVQQFFSWLDASQVICFLDSCYSGTAGGRSFDHPEYQTRAMLSDEFLESLASEGRFVVTACSCNEVSLESPQRGHGLFTHYLIEGLRGAADGDRDGKVTIDELYEFVYENVERDARAIGGSMNPVKKGSVRGTVYLTEYETSEQTRQREALQEAADAWARGDAGTARSRWTEVVGIDGSNVAAREGLAAIDESDRRRAADLERREKTLVAHVKSGQLTMAQYSRALELLHDDPTSLAPEDQQRRRFVDSLVAGELTVRAYLRAIDLVNTSLGGQIRSPFVPTPTPSATPALVTPPRPPPPATEQGVESSISRSEPSLGGADPPTPTAPTPATHAPQSAKRVAFGAGIVLAAIVAVLLIQNRDPNARPSPGPPPGPTPAPTPQDATITDGMVLVQVTNHTPERFTVTSFASGRDTMRFALDGKGEMQLRLIPESRLEVRWNATRIGSYTVESLAAQQIGITNEDIEVASISGHEDATVKCQAAARRVGGAWLGNWSRALNDGRTFCPVHIVRR